MTGERESVSEEKSKDLLVSFIIPVYQVSDYVERCLLSVMNQTYQNIECIIVDDCSIDDSITKCERLIDGYQGPINFKILHHKENRGLSAARNTGTDAATGDYIFYLDSDDELTIDCLEKLTQPIYNDATVEMVLGYFNIIGEENPTVSINHKTKVSNDVASLREVRDYFYKQKCWFPIAAWNKLIRKDFLDYNQLQFIEGLLFEDNPWTFFVVKKLEHLYVIPHVTYLYRQRPFSIMTGSSEELKALHHGNGFEIISSNFTPSEEGMEAAFYLEKYYSYFLNYSKMQPYPNVVTRFKAALCDGCHTKERVFLFIIERASKTIIGRFFFKATLTARIVLLRPFR